MGWQVVGTDGGSWAAAGRGVSEHTSLPSAMDAAALGGHTIINEAIERSKFIVRDIADPTAVELQQFSGGPWRVWAAPWSPLYGWTVVVDGAGDQAVAASPTNLAWGREHGVATGCVFEGETNSRQ